MKGRNSTGDEIDPAEIPAGTRNQNQRSWIVQATSRKHAESSARTLDLERQIQLLRSQVKNKRGDISQRRVNLTQRYSDAESAKYQIAEREAATLSGIQNATKKTGHIWNALHGKTVEARVFLCKAAASLYGLRQLVEKRDDRLKESFVVGGVSIIDLRDMNGK